MMEKLIGLSETNIDEEEIQAVTSVLRSGWLSQGEKVAALEERFAKSTGLAAVAVSSCTAGLHMVLETLNLERDDEVLVPGVTFVATVNAVLYTGAKPVPVDIGFEQPHMDLASAKKAITPKTRAIMLMHYGGYRMDLEAWRDFALENNLQIIEDAAHCPGLEGIGQLSDAAVLSFFANKNMTTAEGGMILTKNDDIAAKLKRMRGHGMTTDTLTRAKGHAYSYDTDMLGWNYRMDEIRAAVGLAQFEKLQAHNDRRRELTSHYRSRLSKMAPWIRVPFNESWPTVAHLMAVLLPHGTDRDKLMHELRQKGINTSVHYPMYHHFTWHKELFPNLSLPHTEDWCERSLTLPLHPRLALADVDYVAEQLAEMTKPS